MTRLLLSFLLCLCYLLRPLSASSQAIAPLRPLVVQLDSGTVVRRPLIGLDPATYETTRRYVASADQLLLVRADRIVTLERATQLADSVSLVASAELRRCRQQASANEAEFQQLAAQARQLAGKPPAPPLLLDGNTYRGAAVGAALLLVLKVLVLH